MKAYVTQTFTQEEEHRASEWLYRADEWDIMYRGDKVWDAYVALRTAVMESNRKGDSE